VNEIDAAAQVCFSFASCICCVESVGGLLVQLAPPPSGDSTPKPTQKTLTPAQQKSHQKAIGAMDDNIRRAELQLSDLEEELADKTRRYQDLIAKIAATKQSIEEIDALLKVRQLPNMYFMDSLRSMAVGNEC
jgi:septal ring factor EnvC (AmiA/AmiB activator)